jgi:hypothetical protein
MSSVRTASLLLCAVIFAAIPIAYAQETTGTIGGTVLDASGAAVPGAAVSITALDRKIQIRSTKTDSAGNYSAPLLPVGKYSVSVEAKGFKKALENDITLNVGDSLTINIKLQVGDVADTVSVEAAPFSTEPFSPRPSTALKSGSSLWSHETMSNWSN